MFHEHRSRLRKLGFPMQLRLARLERHERVTLAGTKANALVTEAEVTQPQRASTKKQERLRTAITLLGHCGSNLISINSLVSCAAGSNFQWPTAVTALCVSIGCPPFTSIDFTVPFGATLGFELHDSLNVHGLGQGRIYGWSLDQDFPGTIGGILSSRLSRSRNKRWQQGARVRTHPAASGSS